MSVNKDYKFVLYPQLDAHSHMPEILLIYFHVYSTCLIKNMFSKMWLKILVSFLFILFCGQNIAVYVFVFFVIHKLNLFSNIRRQKNSFYGKETCSFDPNFQDGTLIYSKNILKDFVQPIFLEVIIIHTKIFIFSYIYVDSF